MNYREIYNRTDGSDGGASYPQYNASVPVKQSAKDPAYWIHRDEMASNRGLHQGARNLLAASKIPMEEGYMRTRSPPPEISSPR